MKILFNPRCTKCRILRKELDANNVEWENVAYLEEPLEPALVTQIFEQYAGNWHDLVRTKEKIWKELGLKIKEISKEKAQELVIAHPRLLERPIVVVEDQVIIARDDETVAKVVGL